ncbi:DUF1758 domain-containing protein [Trichonephila clavipes]|nr:DUF1758 domain-containing protein [Trichonephila clavipes]
MLDRYDNKKPIVQSLIKAFLDQKPISEANCFNLRKLLDTSDECLRGLSALGEQASSKDCWLIYLLLQKKKFDPESRRLWAIKSSEEEFPNMKTFLDFLNVRYSSLGLMLHNESECKIPIRTSAPYLATRCLFQTGLDLERDDPAVLSLIKESFYIDDLMAGAPSSEEAISLIKTLSSILEARGFHLRKWRSNSSEVLSRIFSNWVGDSSNLEIHPDECSKALGLTWNSMKDIFIFNLKLWLLKLDWDSPLPEALATKLKTIQNEFEQVCSIHIPRWIHTASQQITLHGFCDASELAYASVIYAVQPQVDGNNKVTLLVAKSRVAPLKNWKPYIANRTSEILDLVPADSWHYAPTKMNPADIACRGLSPRELPTCVLWWRALNGFPRDGLWPKQPKRDDQTSSVSKERKRTAFSFPCGCQL